MPLLQGLVFDQRRAMVQQAQFLKDGNGAMCRTIVNELLLKAIGTYWKWAYKNQVLQVYANSLSLSQDRFQLMKISFEQGDKPAIDTLESLIQIQNRLIQYEQAKVEFRNSTLELSNFLWFENLTPLEVSENLKPEDLLADWNFLEEKLDPEFIRNLNNLHPEFQGVFAKQQQLEIKERLRREQFKPDLRFNYNFLGTGLDLVGGNSTESTVNNLVTENYKWGWNLTIHFF